MDREVADSYIKTRSHGIVLNIYKVRLVPAFVFFPIIIGHSIIVILKIVDDSWIKFSK